MGGGGAGWVFFFCHPMLVWVPRVNPSERSNAPVAVRSFGPLRCFLWGFFGAKQFKAAPHPSRVSLKLKRRKRGLGQSELQSNSFSISERVGLVGLVTVSTSDE